MTNETNARGILADSQIEALAAAGAILAPPFAPGQAQPASLDLRLGARAWRMRASFLPGGRKAAARVAELSLPARLEVVVEFVLDAVDEFAQEGIEVQAGDPRRGDACHLRDPLEVPDERLGGSGVLEQATTSRASRGGSKVRNISTP